MHRRLNTTSLYFWWNLFNIWLIMQMNGANDYDLHFLTQSTTLTNQLITAQKDV